MFAGNFRMLRNNTNRQSDAPAATALRHRLTATAIMVAAVVEWLKKQEAQTAK